MNLCLVLDENLKLGLGNGIAFDVDLEAMRRLQRPFCLRVNWALDVAVFRLMNSRQQVEIAFPVLFFPASLV